MSSLPERFNSTSAPEPTYLPPPTDPPLVWDPATRQATAFERIATALESIAASFERQVRRG